MIDLPIWFPQEETRDFEYMVSLTDIKNYFLHHHDRWISLFEFGIDLSRFDLIRVNCWKQKIVGFEFKVSKYDLLNDNKWHYYLKYCNTFSFALPMALTIEAKEKLPKNIGILGFYKWRGKDWLLDKDFIVSADWLRRPHGKEISKEIYIRVISLLLNRAKFRAGDIF